MRRSERFWKMRAPKKTHSTVARARLAVLTVKFNILNKNLVRGLARSTFGRSGRKNAREYSVKSAQSARKLVDLVRGTLYARLEKRWLSEEVA